MGFFERFKKSKQPNSSHIIGISIESEEIRGVVYNAEIGKVIRANKVRKTSDIQDDLLSLGKDLKFPTEVAVCLAGNEYQFIETDRPKVDEKELSQALAWSVKDMLPFPLENAVIDYFDKPAQATGQDKINIIVSESALLNDIIKGCNDNLGELEQVSVYDTVLRRLIPKSEQSSLILFQLPGQELILQIVQNGELYFARRLRGYNRLSHYTTDELQLGALDAIGLEIQRSTDYFESQLKQAPISNILLCLDHVDRDIITKSFSDNFGLPIEWLELKDKNDDSVDEYALAIAAAKEYIEYRASDEAIR